MGKLNDPQLRAWIKAGVPIAGRSDGGGLTFTLSKNGVASWILRYRHGGKAKELTLGRYPDLGLADARKLAGAKRVAIQQLVDVAAVKQEQKMTARQQGTFSNLADLWLTNTIRGKHKRPEVTERVVTGDILSALGQKDPKAITSAEITRLLAKINSSGRPSVANKALRHLKSIFDYGEVLGMVERNPAERIKIEHAGGKERARVRFLTQTELSDLFTAIERAETSFGRDNELAVKLLIAFGCRKMELFAARWSEFDLLGQRWRIPAERTKTGDAREIPLSGVVVGWLNELRVRSCNSEYVFPARRTSKRYGHVSPDTTWRALANLDHDLEHFTIHDLRRTSRTLMSELGVPFDVAEKILGHKLPGLAAVYDRGSSFKQQQIAMEKLGELLAALQSGKTRSNIKPIRSEIRA